MFSQPPVHPCTKNGACTEEVRRERLWDEWMKLLAPPKVLREQGGGGRGVGEERPFYGRDSASIVDVY